ncbi:MAG: hypothetical protein ABSD42_08610 [Candidatus Bathyarchaeia archaeon]|jgi:hypothetical protein
MPPQNDFEKQFCLRTEELNNLVKSKKETDLLRISATLRLLLMDGLMHKANRRLRLDIIFMTTDYQVPSVQNVILWSIQDGLYPPHSHMGDKRIALNLDQFLAKPIAIMNKNVLTVKEAIKFEANVKGGVHVDETDSKVPKEVAMDTSMLVVEGHRPTLRQLVSIGLVTLEALKPLYDAIIA